MVYVFQVCWQLASCQQYLYVLLCVQWKTPDDGQRNCPKHVDFHSKNKSEKLEHLIGFIIRIYHDARSTVRQIYHDARSPERYIYDIQLKCFWNEKCFMQKF
jgi:hypothetical protein